MKYILDAIVIGAVIICVFSGRQRGAVRTLILIAGYAAAFAAAVFVSRTASDYVYEKAVRPAVISAVETKSEELAEEYLSPEKLGGILKQQGISLTDEQLAGILDKGENYAQLLTDNEFRGALKKLFTEYCRAITEAFSGVVPEEILEEAEKYIAETEAENLNPAEIPEEEKESLAEIIEGEIIRPVMIKTVCTALFVVTFAAVLLVVSIIARTAGLIRNIPGVRSADSFAGGILGLLQGLLFTAVLSVAANVFINITSNANEYLNTETIAGTFVFKRLYSGTFFLLSLILK
ncbi:MAG: CvpA family protein [Oscillospiraceae bacterium]|nr:CvpA family protein [Oscillospiraceae bacterium]